MAHGAQTERVFGASASSAFYRRDVVLALGGFPEDFGAYFEDIDLSFRIRRAGYEVLFEPASRVWHQVSASHGTTDPHLLRQQSRNEERVFWRNLPAAALPVAIPLHAAVLLGKALRRLRAGELLPFLRGRLDAWRVLAADRRHEATLPTRAGWRRWRLDAA